LVVLPVRLFDTARPQGSATINQIRSMMRVAALYCIHGNLPALEAVIEEVRRERVDRIVVGGDVLPGPMPRECLACLQSLDRPVEFIMGNGDRQALAELAGDTSNLPGPIREVMRWSAERLLPEQRSAVARWPLTHRLPMDGIGTVLFCHATPRSDTEIFTRRTPAESLAPIFAGIGADLVVCGHTHMQHDRRLGGTRVVQAGSVGMPFGEPGSDWVLLGPGVELRHTRYDLRAGAARLQATGYPRAAEFAATTVLNPPSAESMLDRFAAVSL
jgi:predicted phosphodiesterase